MDPFFRRKSYWSSWIAGGLWVALVALAGCSANQMMEDDLPPDAFTDQSGNSGSGDAGDPYAPDSFAEEAPVPAPESLPTDLQSTPPGDLNRSDTVASMAQKYQAEEDAARAALLAAQAQVEAQARKAAAVVGSVRKKKAPSRYRSEKVVVRSKPFESGGSILNGFYFTRADDSSWVDLSQKLYGTPARTEDLKTWNGGSVLKPGTLIYYSSPFRPQDSESMRSFAQEYGGGTEGYAIRRGDTLSRIAAVRYGGSQSWKEIAAENPEIKNPDQIDPGMRIQLPPVKISTVAALEKVSEKPVTAPPAEAPVVASAPVTPPTPASASSVSAPVRMPSSAAPEDSGNFTEGLRLSPEVLAGALVVLLLGALLLRRRSA